MLFWIFEVYSYLAFSGLHGSYTCRLGPMHKMKNNLFAWLFIVQYILHGAAQAVLYKSLICVWWFLKSCGRSGIHRTKTFSLVCLAWAHNNSIFWLVFRNNTFLFTLGKLMGLCCAYYVTQDFFECYFHFLLSFQALQVCRCFLLCEFYWNIEILCFWLDVSVILSCRHGVHCDRKQHRCTSVSICKWHSDMV